jgi:hypothetical protein
MVTKIYSIAGEQMYVQKLRENRKMRKYMSSAPEAKFFPAKVSGSVHNDLILNNHMINQKTSVYSRDPIND